MFKKLKEWISVQLVKNPGRMVLAGILLFNIVFFFIASGIISALSLKGTESMSFIEAAFCTITMILDPGCISFVVSDIGTAGVTITIVCVVIVVVGMISFTGAVIGYVTNYISNFIENANAGKRKLYLSNHFVLINWNSRASEIVNDMLYTEKKQRVVVLVPDRKQEIEKEIEERLADTIAQENKAVMEKYKDLGYFARKRAIRKNRFKRNVTVLVREGDVFSSKQLRDIALDKARSIIVLEGDINGSSCKYETAERKNEMGKGNSLTVKTLMQVADITAAESSADNQRIIVEITDVWTWDIVSKIIKAKQVEGKCNIIPVRVNEVLGQILSQFCLNLTPCIASCSLTRAQSSIPSSMTEMKTRLISLKTITKNTTTPCPLLLWKRTTKGLLIIFVILIRTFIKNLLLSPLIIRLNLKRNIG